MANRTKQQLKWFFQCDLWFHIEQQSPRRPCDNHLSSNHLLLNFFSLSTLQADVVNIWIETSYKKSVVLLLNLVSFYHKFDSLMVLSLDLILPLAPLARRRFDASFINKGTFWEALFYYAVSGNIKVCEKLQSFVLSQSGDGIQAPNQRWKLWVPPPPPWSPLGRVKHTLPS